MLTKFDYFVNITPRGTESFTSYIDPNEVAMITIKDDELKLRTRSITLKKVRFYFKSMVDQPTCYLEEKNLDKLIELFKDSSTAVIGGDF